jgi:hypothetical protein
MFIGDPVQPLVISAVCALETISFLYVGGMKAIARIGIEMDDSGRVET